MGYFNARLSPNAPYLPQSFRQEDRRAALPLYPSSWSKQVHHLRSY